MVALWVAIFFDPPPTNPPFQRRVTYVEIGFEEVLFKI